MLITTARHEREIAAKDAEIAGLMSRLSRANADLLAEEMVANDRLTQIRKLHARLAVFTGPRQRDAKGHFLPTKGRAA